MSEKKNSNNRELSNLNERRRKSDWITRATAVLSALSWFVVLIVWALLEKASPEKHNMLTNILRTTARGYWEPSLIHIVFILLIISMCLSIFAFIFNMLRMRRKTDKYRKSVIIIGVINFIGIILFINQFGRYF